MEKIKVHITDDHPIVVEPLIPVINASEFACVTGSSFRLSECRKALVFNRPDVLLLDISMPDGDGIVFCAEIHKLYPQMKIIALTGHDEYSSAMQMLKNGASGYILKSETVSEVLEAIYAVMQGDTYISEQMDTIIRKTTKEAITLTPREKEVLQMVAKGMSNLQIGNALGIELSTVNSFRKKLNLKIGASGPLELVTKSRKKGLIDN